MKFYFILFFSLFFSYSVFSQDLIIKNNGDTVVCKISEINPFYLQYRLDSVTHYFATDSIIGYQLENMDYVSSKKIKKYHNESNNDYKFAISPGIGANHGLGGVKVLFGSDGNSGVFGCVGYGVYSVYWKFGGQINAKWFYLACSIGTMEFYQTLSSSINIIYGLTLETGGIINLSRNKRFFLQLGLGLNVPEKKIDPYTYYYNGPIYSVDFSGIMQDVSIGIRF